MSLFCATYPETEVAPVARARWRVAVARQQGWAAPAAGVRRLRGGWRVAPAAKARGWDVFAGGAWKDLVAY